MAASPRPIALPRLTKVVRAILVILGALWLVGAISANIFGAQWPVLAYEHLSLRPKEALTGGKLWQLFSYFWLHHLQSLGHVLFNALGLYFLGTALERRWGSRNFLRFYLLSGLGAGLFTALTGTLLGGQWAYPVLGASGGLFALITAFSTVLPRAKIALFFVLQIEARWLLPLALGLDILLFIASPGRDVALHTHIGGALTGWLLVTGNWRPRLLRAKWRRRRLHLVRDRNLLN